MEEDEDMSVKAHYDAYVADCRNKRKTRNMITFEEFETSFNQQPVVEDKDIFPEPSDAEKAEIAERARIAFEAYQRDSDEMMNKYYARQSAINTKKVCEREELIARILKRKYTGTPSKDVQIPAIAEEDVQGFLYIDKITVHLAYPCIPVDYQDDTQTVEEVREWCVKHTQFWKSILSRAVVCMQCPVYDAVFSKSRPAPLAVMKSDQPSGAAVVSLEDDGASGAVIVSLEDDDAPAPAVVSLEDTGDANSVKKSSYQKRQELYRRLRQKDKATKKAKMGN